MNNWLDDYYSCTIYLRFLLSMLPVDVSLCVPFLYRLLNHSCAVVQLYSCKVAQLYSCAVVQLHNLPSLCSPSVELYIWPDVQLYSCKVVLGCSADFKTVFLISSINYLYFLWYMQILVGQTHWYCFSHRLGWSKEIRYF